MKIGTHNGKFHADDAFACAALTMLFPDAEIIRTRDLDLLAECDFRVDVGDKYDPSTHDYDHHQEGGAGTRGNGIKYSAFGLVWKHLGGEICLSAETARMIDKRLVVGIDANDNGQKLIEFYKPEDFPNDLSFVIGDFNSTWEEEPNEDERFLQALAFARDLLRREMAQTRAMVSARSLVRAAVRGAADPRVVMLERFVPWKLILVKETEALYVIYQGSEGLWRVEGVTKLMSGFDTRKPLPAAWAGKKDEEFAALTGVPDATFCHNECFFCGARSRDGALTLAKLALDAPIDET